jgi:hypothetical protein
MIGSEHYYYACIAAEISFFNIGLWYYPPQHREQIRSDLSFYTKKHSHYDS